MNEKGDWIPYSDSDNILINMFFFKNCQAYPQFRFVRLTDHSDCVVDLIDKKNIIHYDLSQQFGHFDRSKFMRRVELIPKELASKRPNPGSRMGDAAMTDVFGPSSRN